MTDPITPTTQPIPDPDLPGDFATGEHTIPTGGETLETERQGDFAAGERTESLSEPTAVEGELHGDFAAGERTDPLTEATAEEGTFDETSTPA
jgi:hypothetical protein